MFAAPAQKLIKAEKWLKRKLSTDWGKVLRSNMIKSTSNIKKRDRTEENLPRPPSRLESNKNEKKFFDVKYKKLLSAYPQLEFSLPSALTRASNLCDANNTFDVSSALFLFNSFAETTRISLHSISTSIVRLLRRLQFSISPCSRSEENICIAFFSFCRFSILSNIWCLMAFPLFSYQFSILSALSRYAKKKQ